MRKILIKIILLLSFPGIFAFASKSKIDSLKSELVSMQHDTNRINIVLEIGYLYWNINPEKTIEYADQALKLSQKLDYKKGLIRGHEVTGIGYWAQGNYQKALEKYLVAFNLAKDLNKPEIISRILNNQGLVYRNLGNPEKALSLYFRALEIAESLVVKKSEAKYLNNIGEVYFNLGEFDKALGFYNKSLIVKEKIKDRNGIAITFINIGNIQEKEKKLSEAFDSYTRAMTIFNSTGHKRGQSVAINNIGQIYLQQEKYIEAQRHFLESLKLKKEINEQKGLIKVYNNLARIKIHEKNYETAEDYLNSSLRIVEDIGQKEQEIEVYRIFSELNEARHQYRKALFYHKKYNALRDSIFNKEKSKLITEMQTRYESEKKDREIALLNKENALREREIQIKNLIITASIISILLALVLAFVLYRGNIQKKKTNILLSQQKDEISKKNIILNEQKIELVTQSDEINQRKIQLEKINTIVKKINSAIGFDELLNSILFEIVALKEFKKALAFVYNNKLEAFEIKASQGWSDGDLQSMQLSENEIEYYFIENSEEIYEDIFLKEQSANLKENIKSFQISPPVLTMRVKIEGSVEGYFIFADTQSASLVDYREKDILSSLREHFLSAFIKGKILEELRVLNEIKNEFLGMAAHDLRNPLATIAGFIDLSIMKIQSDQYDPQQELSSMQEILKVSEHMTFLINSILDVSAIESGKVKIKLQKENLIEIIRFCEKYHRHHAEKKDIDLILTCDPDLPNVLADRERISEVINNLLSNAIKYTYPGGKVSLSCEHRENQLITHVIDSGQGLNENDLNDIFKSFKKLSAKPTGGEISVGLGLAIAKKIVDLHDGKIWVSSEKDRGSTFSFSLPVYS